MIYLYDAFGPESICYITKNGAAMADDYSRAKFSLPNHIKGLEKIEGGISSKAIKYALSIEGIELQAEVLENALCIFSPNKDKQASFAYIKSVPEHIAEYTESLSTQKLSWVKGEAAKNFVDGLVVCKDTASGTLSHPSLAYLSIRRHKIYASDAKQLSICQLDEKVQCDKEDILLHSIGVTKLEHLRKGGIAAYAVGGNEFHFISEDGVIMSLRMGEAEYPDFDSLLKLNKKENGVVVQLDHDFMSTLERTILISPDIISIEVTKEEGKGEKAKVTMLGTNKLGESVKEKLTVGTTTKSNFNLNFDVSASVLWKLLKGSSSFEIEIGSNLIRMSGKNGSYKFEHYIPKKDRSS